MNIYKLNRSQEVKQDVNREPETRQPKTLKAPLYHKLNAVCTTLKHILLLCGCILIIFSIMAYCGKTTPFQRIELTGVEDSLQELAKTIAVIQDTTDSLRMKSEKVNKQKVNNANNR